MLLHRNNGGLLVHASVSRCRHVGGSGSNGGCASSAHEGSEVSHLRRFSCPIRAPGRTRQPCHLGVGGTVVRWGARVNRPLSHTGEDAASAGAAFLQTELSLEARTPT